MSVDLMAGVIAVVAIALCGGWLAYLAVLAVREFQRNRRAIARKALSPSEKAFNPSRWIALPGQRMELGATAFAISLHTGLSGSLYKLWSPEGRMCWEGYDLPYIKQLGERLAAEREEFVCRDHLPITATKVHR
jgi:hypothetical protein